MGSQSPIVPSFGSVIGATQRQGSEQASTSARDLFDEGGASGRIGSILARRYISPLRYPGGKRKLASHVAGLLDRHNLKNVDRIIEPFAGGAATSIAFLEAGLAREAVLNDLDPLVSAFWATVFSRRADQLADRILDAKIDLQTWDDLRASDPTDEVDRAFKCLFLNRTSFSGSLKKTAGPIGGRKQESEYSIDCRWNAEGLAERVWGLSKLQDRVTVRSTDFRRFMGSYRSACSRRPDRSVLWYIDPPFFHKADALYRFWFNDRDHKALEKSVRSLPGLWMLSYDNCLESREMYADHPGRAFVDMRYTAAKRSVVQRLDCTELVVTGYSPATNASGNS